MTSFSLLVSTLRQAGCVFAEDEARLLLAAADDPSELVRQRVAGVPLEHLLGWAEFCGRHVVVDRGVFVPRRRSELLVRLGTPLLQPGAVVVDLCCGSGAVGSSFVDVELHAVDVDPLAVACAEQNVIGKVYLGDLFAPLPTLRADLIVAVTPYVPTWAIRLLPHEARDFEPLVALDGGLDGLDVVRRVVAEAPGWLAPGGHLLVEVSGSQVAAVTEQCRQVGLVPEVVVCEDLGATVVVARAPGLRGGEPDLLRDRLSFPCG